MSCHPEASRRARNVAPFLALDVLREANALEAAGKKIVHLEIGQPAAPAPEIVRRSAAAALSDGARLGYTETLGLAALRARIAQYYGDTHNVDIGPGRVVITTGSSGAFILAFLACFDAGARVGLAEPGYPAYRNILASIDAEPVAIPVGPETGWALTPDLVARAEAAHGALAGLMVASPSNPTGTMLDAAELSALANDCADAGRWLISDEIYHGVTYGTPAATALGASADALIVNSFSKYYCMTGWRRKRRHGHRGRRSVSYTHLTLPTN